MFHSSPSFIQITHQWEASETVFTNISWRPGSCLIKPTQRLAEPMMMLLRWGPLPKISIVSVESSLVFSLTLLCSVLQGYWASPHPEVQQRPHLHWRVEERPPGAQDGPSDLLCWGHVRSRGWWVTRRQSWPLPPAGSWNCTYLPWELWSHRSVREGFDRISVCC